MKILAALLGLIITTGAYCEEEYEESIEEEYVPVVVERMSCSDMQKRMSELKPVAETDDDAYYELENLKTQYRSTCTRSASARRVSGRNDIVVEEVVYEEEYIEDVVEEESEPVVETVTETVTEKEVEPVEPELTAEQIDANFAAGLCADGAKPNKFGCCADEIFKDMGNAVFACCPKSGGDCFPPIEKEEQ
mgnify:CR=1 FL=1